MFQPTNERFIFLNYLKRILQTIGKLEVCDQRDFTKAMPTVVR